MLSKLLIAAVAAALVVPAAWAGRRQTPPAQPATLLMPGVAYEDGVQFTPDGPVAVHVIRAPRPGGLYAVAPLLSNDAILGRESLTDLQKRLAPTATIASVDGDLSATDGHPSGILIRGGALDHTPLEVRSSAGFDGGGTLHVDRVALYGYWKGAGQRQRLDGVNQAPDPGQSVLFTGAWGAQTPRAPDAVDAILAPFPAAAPNVELTAPVTQLVQGGGSDVPAGGAVLQVRGQALAQTLGTDAPAGTTMRVRLGLQPDWTGVVQALGGGPILVRDGRAVFRSGEAFDPSLLVARSPRTAVGQAADGTVLLVVVDGDRPGYSIGMTNFELALTMQRLGATWAMALAPGASSAMAFDGTLLSRPSGPEQAVAEALSVVYYGVYAPPPATAVFSPNGDGVGESQTLSYKVVRPSTVHALLLGPAGAQVVVDDGHRDPGVYTFPFTGSDASGAPLPEGQWRWRIDATDDAGNASQAERPFSFDRTLGFEQATPALVRVGPQGGTLTVTARLARPATVTLQVETPYGNVVATAVVRAAPAGTATLTWDGLLPGGGPAPSGRYVARLIAASAVGSSELEQPFSVRRVAH